MVHGFVTQSGGAVQITTKDGEGTTVELFFPASDSTQTATQQILGSEEHPINQAHILVAEDQPAVLKVLRQSLESIGYTVVTALSGEEAARLYNEADKIDLLITDIAMPGAMQGFDLAEHIRRITPDLPVIFMSGYTPETENKDKWLRDNDVRLTKPFPRAQLYKVVYEALKAKDKV